MRKILRMRRMIALLAMVMALSIGLATFTVGPAQAQQTLNLKAVWNPNGEPDMAGYYFFDGTNSPYRAWKGAGVWGTDNTNPVALPLSPQLLLFTYSVPDTPVTGTLKFCLKAFDTNNNVSLDSPLALYTYNIDTTPPAAPTGLTITKQP